MYPWIIDARKMIKDVTEIDDSLIERTSDIAKFLKHNMYYFVVGTKGLGKSLLLLAKRKQLKGIEHVIPNSILIDVPEIDVTVLNSYAYSILYKEDSMARIWALSIILSIAKVVELKEDLIKRKEGSEILINLLDKDCSTVSDYFNALLTSIKSRDDFEIIEKDYNDVLSIKVKHLKVSIAIFIDNIDECFESAEKEIWRIAQNGLVKAVVKVCGLNPGKINVFASIRKEAFLSLQENAAMFQQYSGLSLHLLYYKDQLKDIFIKNINKESDDNLRIPELLKKAPIVSFVGTDKIQHGDVQEKEDTFDYIYRHTLQRPRDLMEIGAALAKFPKSYRDPNDIDGLKSTKNIINEAGTTIANEYLKEVEPHISLVREDFDRLFELIDSNILEKSKVKKICMKYNGGKVSCLDLDCKTCSDKKHVFCELYKIGLLGYVDTDSTEKDNQVQKFERVGEKTFEAVGLLPPASYYLVHPVLDGLIRKKNTKYKKKINTLNIVGYDRIWKSIQKVPATSKNKPVVLVSSTLDLKPYRDIIDAVASRRYRSIMSERENGPRAVEKCKQFAKECNYFVAILGPHYGETYKNRSFSEIEFDSAYNDNPDKIIVYLLDGNVSTWDKQQQAFVTKVQGIKGISYMRGSRINKGNLKKRFNKDIIEKENELTKPRK